MSRAFGPRRADWVEVDEADADLSAVIPDFEVDPENAFGKAINLVKNQHARVYGEADEL